MSEETTPFYAKRAIPLLKFLFDGNPGRNNSDIHGIILERPGWTYRVFCTFDTDQIKKLMHQSIAHFIVMFEDKE
jgi:hypothetical protein